MFEQLNQLKQEVSKAEAAVQTELKRLYDTAGKTLEVDGAWYQIRCRGGEYYMTDLKCDPKDFNWDRSSRQAQAQGLNPEDGPFVKIDFTIGKDETQDMDIPTEIVVGM